MRHGPCSIRNVAAKQPARLSRSGTERDTASRRNRCRNETRFNARIVRLLEPTNAVGAGRLRVPISIRPIFVTSSATHFMLTADFVDDIRFRLAGTRVCALFAREIKGEAFNSLWSETSREHVEELLIAVLVKTLAQSPALLGAPKTAPKSNWNCCCCRLPLMAEPAFARSVFWLP